MFVGGPILVASDFWPIHCRFLKDVLVFPLLHGPTFHNQSQVVEMYDRNNEILFKITQDGIIQGMILGQFSSKKTCWWAFWEDQAIPNLQIN